MLCRLAVRRIIHESEDRTEYILRVAGEHTLGSAGTLSSDEKTFANEQEFVECLRALGLPETTILKAEASARQPASSLRFIGFAENEQIAFDRLANADFDLFAD